MRGLLITLALAVMSTSVTAATAPEPPQNLSAMVTDNTVTLTWQAPASGSTPLGYLVEAALSPGGAAVAAFLVLDPSIVRTAVPDGVYYVRVRSGNAEGISATSTEVVVSVPGEGGPCPLPPNPPTNLTATVLHGLVTLSWVPPSAGCLPTGYVVQAGSAPGLSDLAIFNVGDVTTLPVPAPPGAYLVRVIAVNAFGGSGASNELTVLVGNLTGTWSGTSNYVNAPFQVTLTQQGRFVSGQYQDQHDAGAVFGEVTGTHVRLDVNFGDTGIRYEGTIDTVDGISGTLLVPVLGRTFTFEMVR